MLRHPIHFLVATLLLASGCTVMLPPSPGPVVVGGPPVATANRPAANPIIQSFTANPSNSVPKGQTITFQVVAYDPAREPLQFNWTSTGGTLSTNTGQVVSWAPPEKPGVYTVMVSVASGRGGFVTGSQNLTVLADGTTTVGAQAVSTPTPAPSAEASATPTATPSASPSPAPAVSPSPTSSPAPSESPSAEPTLAPVDQGAPQQ